MMAAIKWVLDARTTRAFNSSGLVGNPNSSTVSSTSGSVASASGPTTVKAVATPRWAVYVISLLVWSLIIGLAVLVPVLRLQEVKFQVVMPHIELGVWRSLLLLLQSQVVLVCSCDRNVCYSVSNPLNHTKPCSSVKSLIIYMLTLKLNPIAWCVQWHYWMRLPNSSIWRSH